MEIKRVNNNCVIVGGDVISYETKVAEVKDGKLVELGKWSATTSKHVRKAANELGLELVEYKNK